MKKKKGAKRQPGGVPFSEAIAEQMEGLPWGLHYGSVIAYFERQIRNGYKEQLKKANGAVEEDGLRSEMMKDIDKLKKSLVKFDGQRTGFESSLIAPEFTHNNNETMLMWDAGKYVEYLFFFKDRFWKRVRTFRKDSFETNITFDSYVATLTNRFGQGKEVVSNEGDLEEIQWLDHDTYMFARDKSGFYGVYCLIFSARVTEDNLDRLRGNQGRADGSVGEGVSNIVTSATGGELSDHDTSVVDSYTGKDVGGSKTGEVDAEHSVMRGKVKSKSGNKKAQQDTAAQPKKEEASDGVSDLF